MNYEHQEDENGEPLKPLTGWKAAVHDTLLGDYLETREAKYFWALILHIVGVGIFAYIVFTTIHQFGGAGVFASDKTVFFGRLFFLGSICGWVMAASSFLRGRLNVAFGIGLASALITFLTYIRPAAG